MADYDDQFDQEEYAINVAAKRLGFTLKRQQKDVILKFMHRSDVLAILPAGFGKSLCYGLLPIIFDMLMKREGSIVLVVSPLIALMKDQVTKFASKGLNAIRIGNCSPEVEQQIERGEF
jgi:superfamily II DNA helicase RecQ